MSKGLNILNIPNKNQEIIMNNNKNYITIKHFGDGQSSIIHSEFNLESKEVFSSAVEAAFNTNGFGLQHWEFIERSFKNNILSEVYRYYEDDSSYYQLRFSRELNI